MAIDVEWQDERGDRLLGYAGIVIDKRLPESAPSNSVCLRFIDPYGDTIFNASQIGVLEKELAMLSESTDDVGAQANALLEFILKNAVRTHCYLKFIGD